MWCMWGASGCGELGGLAGMVQVGLSGCGAGGGLVGVVQVGGLVDVVK